MNESKLTYAQIELLQYILQEHMFNTSTLHSKEYISLKYKLITMRAELEYPKCSVSKEVIFAL
jgi:hypothetical protein